MKRLLILLSLLPALVTAQVMHVHKTDGTVLDFPTSEVSRLTFTDATPTPVPPDDPTPGIDMNDGSYSLMPTLSQLGISDPLARVTITEANHGYTYPRDCRLFYDAGRVWKCVTTWHTGAEDYYLMSLSSPLTMEAEVDDTRSTVFNIRTNALGFITSCDMRRVYDYEPDDDETLHADLTYDAEGHLVRVVCTFDFGYVYTMETEWKDGNIVQIREAEDSDFSEFLTFVYDPDPAANLNTSHVIFGCSPGYYILGDMIYSGMCGFQPNNFPTRVYYGSDENAADGVYDIVTSYDAQNRVSTITATDHNASYESITYTYHYLSDGANTRPRHAVRPTRQPFTRPSLHRQQR